MAPAAPPPDRDDRAGAAAGRRPGKIAMTAPVLQQAAGRPGRYLVQFVMPSHLTAETLPVPRDARVRTREIRRSWRRRCDSPAGGRTRRLRNAPPRCAGPSPDLACGQPARCVMPVSTRCGHHGSPGGTRSFCPSRSNQDSCRGSAGSCGVGVPAAARSPGVAPRRPCLLVRPGARPLPLVGDGPAAQGEAGEQPEREEGRGGERGQPGRLGRTPASPRPRPLPCAGWRPAGRSPLRRSA